MKHPILFMSVCWICALTSGITGFFLPETWFVKSPALYDTVQTALLAGFIPFLIASLYPAFGDATKRYILCTVVMISVGIAGVLGYDFLESVFSPVSCFVTVILLIIAAGVYAAARKKMIY
jgi:uncharacterized membrane protein YuzA (DUF378 family)